MMITGGECKHNLARIILVGVCVLCRQIALFPDAMLMLELWCHLEKSTSNFCPVAKL